MVALPPGVILQLLYLKERLATLTPGQFIEIGPGRGDISRVLLDLGWRGVGFEIEEETVSELSNRFGAEVSAGRYDVVRSDWLESSVNVKVDLVISCMVIEHLDEPRERAFLAQAAKVLKTGGMMIGLVPASPAAWGIEDDVAGHFRRYTRPSLKRLITENGWHCTHMAGLTFPVSNLLLPFSNWLVNRHERAKLSLTVAERTKLSGHRRVMAKTHFPPSAALLLNEPVFRPLHWLQKRYLNSDRALVLYFEAKVESEGAG
ncbi:MAG: class I SAM-dependent methyltransferase, partial [Gammaproteobacteria bacterium]|nr:class I SAM-dependent methyltransferase [Gammaproteobacteria bacterium]